MTTPPPEENADLGAPYTELGWTAKQARVAVMSGPPSTTAGYWMQRAGLTPGQCLAWWSALGGYARFTDAETLTPVDWADAGIRHPQDRPPGMSPQTALMCAMAKVPPSPDWGDRHDPRDTVVVLDDGVPGEVFLCPTLVHTSFVLRQTPKVAAGLLDTLLPRLSPLRRAGLCEHTLPGTADRLVGAESVGCGWSPSQVEFTQRFMRSLNGLDWADVTTCLHTGMGPEEARDFVRSGADMDPVRLLAALG